MTSLVITYNDKKGEGNLKRRLEKGRTEKGREEWREGGMEGGREERREGGVEREREVRKVGHKGRNHFAPFLSKPKNSKKS